MTKSIATRAPTRQLLARLLDEPELVHAVRALEARALGQLVGHLGLEDSGEILSLATTEQIAQVFDEDLWQSARVGQDETFDAERFALWLEVMLEAGDAFTAQRLSELDPDLVTLAFSKQVLVIDVDALAVQVAERRAAGGIGEDDDDNMIEKALESALSFEIGQYQLIARRHDGWDAVLTALLALDQNHHHFLESMLERCCEADAGRIEEGGGLYQVLTSGETLESDVAGDRADRREQQGYVAPSDATSFLNLIAITALDAIGGAREPDPITRAYFRAYEARPAARPARGNARAEDEGARRARARLDEALREIAPPPAVPRLAPGDRQPVGAAPADAEGDAANRQAAAFRRALGGLREKDRTLADRRLTELSYLANVVISGCRWSDRRVRPAEAADIVMTVGGRGLAHLLNNKPAVEIVASEDAVKLFRLGWKLLDAERALPAGLRWDQR